MAEYTIQYNTEPAKEPSVYRVEFTEPTFSRMIGVFLGYSTFTFSDIQALADWVESWDNEPPLYGFTIKSIEKIGEPGQ